MARLSVLVVDDDQDACQCLRDFLVLDGHIAAGARDPVEALSLLRTQDFHVVVLDLLLPQLSGVELLRQIRGMDSDVAAIILTGYPSVDSAAASIPLNISAYLKKPFPVEEFRATLGRIAKEKGICGSTEDELLQTIGKRLRDQRKKQGLTLRQLARRTGLSISALSQIERAESSVSVSSLLRLAQALDDKLVNLLAGF